MSWCAGFRLEFKHASAWFSPWAVRPDIETILAAAGTSLSKLLRASFTPKYITMERPTQHLTVNVVISFCGPEISTRESSAQVAPLLFTPGWCLTTLLFLYSLHTDITSR